MKETVHLFKIGGGVLEEQEELEETLGFFSNLPGRKLLVHGGGRRASRMSRQLGISPKMHLGRRITDANALEVVVMVYAGLENKKIVSRLQALNCDAIGLSGADGNIILASRRPVKEVDYGYVGDIKAVNTHNLSTLLEAGLTPVFCAITHDGKGQLLNTNADTVAAELAIALSDRYALHLYFCFEKPGVMADVEEEDSVIRYLDPALYVAYHQQGVIADGMLPKLDNGFRALKAGVASVQAGNWKALARGKATQLLLTTDFPEE